jgi:MFS transporter, PAT family, beta-lactamase induction signal transducer AmpG
MLNSIRSDSLQKFGLLGCLYIAQTIPITFFTQALPIFLRQQGASLQAVGMLSLLALPWMVRFLWAPLVDRYGWTKWGHYKVWIMTMQSLLILLTALCILPSIHTSFPALVSILLLMGMASATQDIGTDALAVGLLTPAERGIGNSLQISGTCLGAMIGGGGLLIFLDRWGWASCLSIMVVCLLLTMLPVIFHHEALHSRSQKSSSNFIIGYWQSFRSFFRRPNVLRWLGIMMLFAVGIGFASTMFRPLLVDIGLSTASIGILLGVVNNLSAVVGSLLAGLIVNRWGQRRSLIGFTLFQAFAIGLYILPALGVTQLPILYLVAIAFQFAFSMALTVFYSIMMEHCHPETAATDFSVQVSLLMLAGLGTAGFSGFITAQIGYQGIFAISAGICFAATLLFAKVFATKRSTAATTTPLGKS